MKGRRTREIGEMTVGALVELLIQHPLDTVVSTDYRIYGEGDVEEIGTFLLVCESGKVLEKVQI